MNYSESLKIVEAFLDSEDRCEDCFSINHLQGAMVACLSCPEYVDVIDIGYLTLTADDKEGIDAWFGDEQLRRAWSNLMNDLGDELANEEYRLAELYPLEKDATKPSDSFAEWCQGYLAGYFLTQEAWQEAHEFLTEEEIPNIAEEHTATLDMISAFADWEEALAENKTPQRLLDNIGSMLKVVDDGVSVIHALALLLEDNRINTMLAEQPVVRDEPKVGRNDPCPCGSGKKYKRCCLN